MKRLLSTLVIALTLPFVLVFFAWLGLMAGLGAVIKTVIDVWQHEG